MLFALIVEDDSDIGEIIKFNFKRHDIDSTVVDSAEEALEYLETNKNVNCVVSDIHLPKMTGLELGKKSRLSNDRLEITKSSYLKAS